MPWGRRHVVWWVVSIEQHRRLPWHEIHTLLLRHRVDLLDHLRDTKGFQLRQVRYLILDEADRMLSMDFEEELHSILDNIPSDRQTMLFSATMTSQVQKLMHFETAEDCDGTTYEYKRHPCNSRLYKWKQNLHSGMYQETVAKMFQGIFDAKLEEHRGRLDATTN
jgi:hypothetical protein